MNPYIWFSRKSRITGTMLKDELGFDGGISRPPTNTNFLICWGMGNNVSHLNLGNGEVCILNHPDKRYTATNKLQALSVLNEAGVSVPPFQTTEEIQRNGLELNFPMIGRKDFHQGGSGLYFCRRFNGKAIRNGCTHFLQFIPSITEYRVHIFMDKIVRIQEKIPSEEQPITNERIRNHRYGWRFAWRPYANEEYPREVVDEAKKAMNALNLEFGAVDVLWGQDENPYVLEVNTAPALDGSGIETYGNKIKNFFEKVKQKLNR